MPEPPLLLRLHGEPLLTLPDGRAVALEPRAAALLALAALEPGLTRLRAASLLWPDSGDPRRNLRQQLLRFRRQFGGELLVGRDTLALAAAVHVVPGEQPLLAGLAFDEIEDFAAWLAQRRREALAQRAAALREALAAAEVAGDLAAALREAERLVALDARDEAHHRELMRLHYLGGNTAAGLAAYERLATVLREEFGTRPSAASVQLAETLRSAMARPVPLRATPAALPVTLKRPPWLAGRTDELARVRQALAEGRVAWIEGEAGLGKSRLVAEVMTDDMSGQALAGAGRPGDAGAPYATLARWLAPALRDGELPASARAALRHLGAGDAGAALPPLRPGELAAAVAALLATCGTALMVLDDLHFADEATLELVAGLAARPEPGIGWLLATRAAELTPAGRALREALIELRRIEPVMLAPLQAPDVERLVDALALDGLHGDTLAAPLVRHTGGNPLFVLETLKQGLHDGSLLRGELPRPTNVSTLIEARLARLDDAALTLARVAAIAGVDFSIELAEAATGQRAVQLAGAWGALQDAQVLRDEAFAHDLVADAVLRGVPAVVARRVHAQCAAWLAEHGGEPARVARHWLAGGEPARAGRAFVAAARLAESAARLLEEAALLAQAADAFGAAGLADERFDALCDRARARKHLADVETCMAEQRALLRQAATEAQRLRAQLELVGMLVEHGDDGEALAAGRELLARARALERPDVQVRAACHLASALCREGQAAEAAEMLLPLRSFAVTQPDPALRMLWLGDWAATLGHLGRLGEAVLAYDDARTAARAAALPDAEGRLLLNCAVTLRQSGQFERALAMAHDGRALASKDGDDALHVGIAKLVVARDENEVGRYDTALAALEAVLPQFEAAGAAFWAAAARMVLCSVWLHLGQPARALPLLAAEPGDVPAWLRADRQLLRLDVARALQRQAPADALSDSLALAETDAQRGAWLGGRALRHMAPEAAHEAARRWLAALVGSERHGIRMTLQAQLAQAALALGRTDEAAAAIDAMVARFEEGCAPDGLYRAEAWLIAARVWTAAGRAADAATAMQRGTQWITQQVLPRVPAPFIDSFLHRNPVNRELLAAASAAAG